MSNNILLLKKIVMALPITKHTLLNTRLLTRNHMTNKSVCYPKDCLCSYNLWYMYNYYKFNKCKINKCKIDKCKNDKE